jgi:hypothetical protein
MARPMIVHDPGNDSGLERRLHMAMPDTMKLLVILLLPLLAAPTNARAHIEELVQSIQNPKNQDQAKSLERDHTGKPFFEVKAVPFKGSPVHEEMTKQSITLSQVHGRKYKLDYDDAYIHGVFWNDDPDDLLCPECNALNILEWNKTWGYSFAMRFLAAEKQARPARGNLPVSFNKGWKEGPLLERSHFGDLQFLHAMASKDGELAKETQYKIMKWAEFAYKVATGEIPQRVKLKEIPIPEIRNLFAGDLKLESKTIEQLFKGPQFVKRVAIGTLLHMVQDSYAQGHADREVNDSPGQGNKLVYKRGRIKEFHCYTNQESDRHAQDDKWPPRSLSE